MSGKQYAVGIDVGGTSLKCGLIDSDGMLSYSFIFPIGRGFSRGEIISLMIAAINKCIGQVSGSIKGVGIGFPGLIENNVVVGGGSNLPDFIGVDFAEIIGATSGFKVVTDNDVNMMASGEARYGAARGAKEAVLLTIGTGIGGSLIVGGASYGGYRGRGGELGHIPIVHKGRACSCGGIGCFESYASVTAMIADYKALKGVDSSEEITAKDIVSSYQEQEVEAVYIMQEHFDFLATGITGLINVFSPEKIIIGGGISEAGRFYIEEIDKRVRQRVIPICSQQTVLCAAELGNKAGMYGCAAQVFDLN